MKDAVYSSKPPIILESGEMVGLREKHDPPHPCGSVQRLSEEYRKLKHYAVREHGRIRFGMVEEIPLDVPQLMV